MKGLQPEAVLKKVLHLILIPQWVLTEIKIIPKEDPIMYKL